MTRTFIKLVMVQDTMQNEWAEGELRWTHITVNYWTYRISLSAFPSDQILFHPSFRNLYPEWIEHDTKYDSLFDTEYILTSIGECRKVSNRIFFSLPLNRRETLIGHWRISIAPMIFWQIKWWGDLLWQRIHSALL